MMYCVHFEEGDRTRTNSPRHYLMHICNRALEPDQFWAFEKKTNPKQVLVQWKNMSTEDASGIAYVPTLISSIQPGDFHIGS